MNEVLNIELARATVLFERQQVMNVRLTIHAHCVQAGEVVHRVFSAIADIFGCANENMASTRGASLHLLGDRLPSIHARLEPAHTLLIRELKVGAQAVNTLRQR